MKPKTKLQRHVIGISNSLPDLTVKQKEWIYNNCLDHRGYRTKTNTWCLDCGHKWPTTTKAKSCACPSCGTKLQLEDTRKKKLNQHIFVALMDVVDGFQINRFWEVKSFHLAGEAPCRSTREVVQQYIDHNGKLTVVGRMMSYCNGGYNGDLEIRTNISSYYNANKFDIYADKLLPESKCLGIYKRNGFTNKLENVQLYTFLKTLLSDSKTETLVKTGQFSLLSARMGRRHHDVYKFWDSIKICIRNKYIVKDGISYLDYLELLQHFRKDLRSPKYVCPANFKKEHSRLVAKKAREQRILDAIKRVEDAEKRKLNAEREQMHYVQEKGMYLDLEFVSGNITARVLQSVQDFIVEGDTHKHCVYTNSYYNKSDSLVFSAQIDGRRIETVEVSLSQMKVVQSRGWDNDPTEYHQQIIDLITKNMHLIKRCMKGATKMASNHEVGAVA